jgi:hypothetical protein
MAKYSLVAVENAEEWDRFVDQSPQGTVFSYSEYLENTCYKNIRHYVYQGSEIKAGLVLNLSDDESCCVLDDLVIYNGIIFRDDKTAKPVKARSERFEITEFIIDELSKKYSSIKMALAPQFEDVRPFLWHNYHSENSNKKFSLDIRYTSYLAIRELASQLDEMNTELFRNLETIRQRNIREARKSGAILTKESDAQLFISFYTALMKEQGETVPLEKLRRMENLIDVLIKNDQGAMYCAQTSEGKPGYITIFCKDRRRAYYLFGAGNPEIKERYLGTIAFWDAFKDLANTHGINEVDLEGVNSPQRGWFKLSFGGDLKCYYQLNLFQTKARLSRQ